MPAPTQVFPPWSTLASLHAIVAMWEHLAETPERDSEVADGELEVAHASDAMRGVELANFMAEECGWSLDGFSGAVMGSRNQFRVLGIRMRAPG